VLVVMLVGLLVVGLGVAATVAFVQRARAGSGESWGWLIAIIGLPIAGPIAYFSLSRGAPS
jgi:hypothetical protein